MFTVYCFALPSENGLKCVEMSTILSSENISVFDPIYNSDIREPVFGGVPGHLAACFGSCWAEWVQVYSATLFVIAPLEDVVSLEPCPGSPYIKFLDCASVEAEALPYTYLYINPVGGCYCWCNPPHLREVTALDETHIDVDFACAMGFYEANYEVENYTVYPKSNPADSLPILDVVFDYIIILGEALLPDTLYTLRAYKIIGYLHSNYEESEIDFMYTPVNALLQDFGAEYRSGSVELSWRLANASGDILFTVSRRTAVGASFEPLESLQIERDGDSFSCTDSYVEPGESYVYRVDYELGGETGLLFETEAVQTPALPLTLHQNVPNPFNPVTEISYYLPAAGAVLLEVYDVTGKRVAALVRGRRKKGLHTVHWQGMDDAGRSAASGIYFYRLRAGKEVISKKMVLLK